MGRWRKRREIGRERGRGREGGRERKREKDIFEVEFTLIGKIIDETSSIPYDINKKIGESL